MNEFLFDLDFQETEHCVHLYPGGEWNDAACDEPRGYICKGPLLSDGKKFQFIGASFLIFKVY